MTSKWTATPYQLVSIIFSILVLGLMAHMLYKLVKPQTAAADINNNDDDEEEGGSHNRIIRRRKRPNPFDMLKWSRHKIYRFLTYIFAAASYISHLINVILDYKSVAEREGMSLDDATEFWNTYYLFPSTIFSIIYNISFDCALTFYALTIIDRYKRIQMVLPKTWSSFLLNMLQGLLFTLNTINITVGIINCGMQLGSVKNGYFLPNGAFYWNYQAMYFQPIVQLTELFIPLVMVLTEWFCNIRLIMTSLRVAKEDVTSFKESLRSASSSSSIAQDQQNNSNNSNNKYVGNNSNQNRAIGSRSRELDNIPSNQTKSNPPSTSTPAKISDSSILMVLNTSLKKRPITQQESQLSLSPPNALLQLKEKEYRWLRVKMILLFTTLTLLDFIVLVIDILMELSFPGNNSAEESNVMASCFVGIHFSISFYLLDLYLRELKRIKRIAKINPEKKKKKEYEPSNTFKSADTSLKQSLKSAISDAVSDERAFGTFNSSLNAQYSDKATIDHPSEVSFSEIDFAGNSSPLSISQLEKRQWPSRIPNPDSAAVIKMKTFKTSRVPIIVTDAHDVSRLMVPAPNNNTRANTLVVPLSEDISSLQYDRSLGYRPSANSSNRSYFESNGASPH